MNHVCSPEQLKAVVVLSHLFNTVVVVCYTGYSHKPLHNKRLQNCAQNNMRNF